MSIDKPQTKNTALHGMDAISKAIQIPDARPPAYKSDAFAAKAESKDSLRGFFGLGPMGEPPDDGS